FYSIKDFSYAPRCRISVSTGEVMNDAYSIMRLFPPDTEDSFRLLTLPHTFYLRYYPEGLMTGGGASAAGQKKGPLYKLRVVKNLDIVFNGYVSADEKTTVGSITIAIDDIKKWVEIAVVRDYGIYLIVPGMVIAVISGIWGVWQRKSGGRAIA
ncbi:MAG: hypothetical protein HZA10_10715, partial [Nitrospirae bacterium]|nr:hypothetical protein [Nitrospirota bacterium]